MKPCPFCGSIDSPSVLPASSLSSDSDEGFFVCCAAKNGGCGAASGWGLTAVEAVTSWSQRSGVEGSNKVPATEKDALLDIMAADAIMMQDLEADLSGLRHTLNNKDQTIRKLRRQLNEQLKEST